MNSKLALLLNQQIIEKRCSNFLALPNEDFINLENLFFSLFSNYNYLKNQNANFFEHFDMKTNHQQLSFIFISNYISLQKGELVCFN